MKIVDLDKIFEDFLRQYMRENAGKFTEAQWEAEIARLYEDFGKRTLEQLDGHSPENYYSGKNGGELAQLLVAHIENGVAVPDYLSKAAAAIKNESAFIALLKNRNDEVRCYALSALTEMGSKNALDIYFELLKDADASHTLKDMACEALVDNCQAVKEKALALCADLQVKDYMTEILVRCAHDQRIFDYLIKEFLNSGEQLAVYAAYLCTYGDERALPYLLNQIEREDIDFAEYQELKCAIEALGGEYNKQRDFSGDIIYKRITEQPKEN